jgi:hypothetical protein
LVLKQGLKLTLTGIALGVAGTVGVGRFVTSLFGVTPTDANTIVSVVATITMVAGWASWLPAWRVSRLDPNVVLRTEQRRVSVDSSEVARRAVGGCLSAPGRFRTASSSTGQNGSQVVYASCAFLWPLLLCP